MRATPSISAVIPVYNGARYLAEAIESVRAQTVRVDEIIVVDDGSEDDSAEVARSLGDDIIVLRQRNAGPAAARNAGIHSARGELIAFLDADDRWVPEKTEAQLGPMATASVALVASDMAETDHEGVITVPSVLGQHGLYARFAELNGRAVPNALRALLAKNFVPTGTVLARRDAVIASGGFDPRIRYGEDLELWARLAVSRDIVCLPAVHMLRRRHDRNATSASGAMLEELVRVMTTIRHWGDAALRAQGVNPDRLVASAYCDLGYWQFDRGNLEAARKSFRSSLREKVTVRGLTYGLVTALPRGLVYRLRRARWMARRL